MGVRLWWAKLVTLPARLRTRRLLRQLDEEKERIARRRYYGCDCGRICRSSPAARRLLAFMLCPDLGCTREVSRTRSAR